MKARWKVGHHNAEILFRHASYAPARRAINLALARSMLSRNSGLSHLAGSSCEEKKEGGSAVSCEIPRTCIFRGVSKISEDVELLGAKPAEAEAYEVKVEAGGDVEGL